MPSPPDDDGPDGSNREDYPPGANGEVFGKPSQSL